MSKLAYAIRQSLRQIRRNKGMTFASMFAITAMLLILGIFMTIIININTAAESIKQDYRNIEMFLKDELSSEQVVAIQDKVKAWDNVEDVTYRSRDEALQILKARWGKNAYLLEGLSNNPLPNSLIIVMDNLKNSDEIAQKASQIEGVEDIKYYKSTIKKLVKLTNILQIVGLVLIVFLILVSVVVVSNTIKLTVLARSEEITIMKYIGAKNWFIRMPFLLEGIFIGLISSAIAAAIVTFTYEKASETLGNEILAMMSSSVVPTEFLTYNLLWIFFALGISIGTWGSIISMRRFLDT